MSDDGWYGDPQAPAPTPGYGQRRAGRAAYGRDEQSGQSGQYPQQPTQAGGYSQDSYQSGEYSQDYSAQQSYYDELGPRSTPPQSWNSQQQDYSSRQPYQQQPYQEPYGQQSYEAQPQPPRGQGQHSRREQAQRASSDPYVSGSYGNDAYGSAPEDYGTGSYGSGTYTQPRHPSAQQPSQGQYSSGSYPTDPYASGGHSRPTQDGYSTGEYPAADRDPRRRSGEYPINRGAPGRGPASTQSQPQMQDPYARRRGTALDTSTNYAQYEVEDDVPGASRSQGRASAYTGEAASRAEGASPRSRRRSAEPADAAVVDAQEPDRFSLIDDEDDEDAGWARGRKPKQKKGRNCLAVFIAFSIIAGGLGYGGYKGVQWYQSKYGTPPDYVSTTGTGTKIDVTIPSGAGGRTIGGLLFDAGVVKSQRAFTDACNSDPKCANIQAGTYLIPKGISAESAIGFLLDPKNQDSKSQLITYGGERASQVFAALETKTGWQDADIRAAIAGGQIDLPSWDTGQPGAKFPYAHIEGFIAAESYVLTDYKTPTELLKKMVDDQMSVFNQENLTAKATALGLTPYKLLIIASLARAEAGTNTADLNKIAGVVFNRFNNPNLFAHLGFDTSTLYGMGNTTTVPNNKDTTNPYNTSVFGIKGLPPSPIDNPDQASVDAALNPNRASNYLYFCATPDGVMYASTNTQWQQLGQKYKGLCGSNG